MKNLNYQITGEDLYDLFGRYGGIRQIRLGNEPKTKGTAFVVFDDVMDVSLNIHINSPFSQFLGQAKNALEHLNGFHLQERYIVGMLIDRIYGHFLISEFRSVVPYASTTRRCECQSGRSQARGGAYEAKTQA